MARDGFGTRAATLSGTGFVVGAGAAEVEVDAIGAGRGGATFALLFPLTATP